MTELIAQQVLTLPLYPNMTNEEKEFLYVIKVILICYASGLNSNITLEFGRRAIPLPIRPDFFEVETTLKEFKKFEKI